MKGVQFYKSRAGFSCVRLHYSADPARDPDTEQGRQWVIEASKGLVGGVNSSDWRQEQEIDWDITGGAPVFPMIQLFRSRIVCAPFEIPEGWSLYAGYDYGHRNPSAFNVHAVDYEGNITTCWEYYKADARYRDQARAIRSCEFFDRLSYMPIADPSIWSLTQQADNEVKSIAQLFSELADDERIHFAPGSKGGDVTLAERILGDLWAPLVLEWNVANGALPGSQKSTGRLKWRIFETCPNLISELEGLRWAEWTGSAAASRNAKEKIVDRKNHAWDATKVVFNMFFAGPVRPQADKYESLKKSDPSSYREWTSMAERLGEAESNQGTPGFGEFCEE